MVRPGDHTGAACATRNTVGANAEGHADDAQAAFATESLALFGPQRTRAVYPKSHTAQATMPARHRTVTPSKTPRTICLATYTDACGYIIEASWGEGQGRRSAPTKIKSGTDI